MSAEPNELEESLKSPIGQIESILRCKQHPERILSGRHRFKYLNTVGKIAQASYYDCERLARDANISHNLAHWLVTRGANIRRDIPPDERTQDIIQMLTLLEIELPENSRASHIAKIAELNGLTTTRIYQLLPKEFKRDWKADESKTILLSEAEKQRFSEDASKHRVSTYTQAEQLFAGNLSYWHVKYRTQEPFVRAGEFSSGGMEKTFVADIFLPDKNIIIELEGSGSASADNPHRDDYFKEKGISVVHLRNETVTKDGAGIANLIAVLLK